MSRIFLYHSTILFHASFLFEYHPSYRKNLQKRKVLVNTYAIGHILSVLIPTDIVYNNVL
jgi:hypothetical protein